ncbi:MAG: hypothetical protein ACK5L5_12830, partial [Bacteroidales bacterium]
IGYYDKYHAESLGDFAKWRNWATVPHIRVYRGVSSDMSTTEIYATTIHELAHAAHWQLVVKASGSNRVEDFLSADNKLTESWALGVETSFTRHFVKSNYDLYNNVGSYHNKDNYTEIVLELMEDAGYTLKELEACLPKAKNLKQWENNIKAKYEKDDEKLKAIFDKY